MAKKRRGYLGQRKTSDLSENHKQGLNLGQRGVYIIRGHLMLKVPGLASESSA